MWVTTDDPGFVDAAQGYYGCARMLKYSSGCRNLSQSRSIRWGRDDRSANSRPGLRLAVLVRNDARVLSVGVWLELQLGVDGG
jgi:hypothetical protein